MSLWMVVSIRGFRLTKGRVLPLCRLAIAINLMAQVLANIALRPYAG